MIEEKDYLEDLLDEIHASNLKNKAEAEKILEDLTKDPTFLERWLK
ncbi:MAG: hypothetical protein AAB706_00610 [Patescibacteria group bacterium]